jgi:hypothetical protein
MANALQCRERASACQSMGFNANTERTQMSTLPRKVVSTMTHRERVLAALAHQEPDRVPFDLGGSAYSINDDHYFS